MNKKHLIKLAAILKENRPAPSLVTTEMTTGCWLEWKATAAKTDSYRQAIYIWEHIVERIAEYCEATNPKFKRNKFLVACGYTVARAKGKNNGKNSH